MVSNGPAVEIRSAMSYAAYRGSIS
jgi:hypothetical protein